ncbi:MnhB domain-containing protein [Streptomyces sp. NPDC008001]|uniref:MnhB domain-containing protein n=1 Tax=Streptomyces sp. NPDC008001 TaxID=3364804 RepID=UPI0036E9BD5F
MTRRVRLWILAVGLLTVAALYAAACTDLPGFGNSWHPYGDRAVRASLQQHTANAVSSVNFDQRAFDTLGEESVLFASVLGTLVLLRQTRGEKRVAPETARVPGVLRRYGRLMLPVALLIGLYVIAHGQLSPGGGFQGGVVVATSVHLLYIAVDYPALERFRRLGVYELADGAGEAAYVLLGAAGLIAGSAYLANTLPLGTFNTLSSGGTVPLLNAAVGVEVTSAVVVLLAHFLGQALELEEDGGSAEKGEREERGEKGA